MLIIRKNEINNPIATVSMNKTLSNPYYLFSFQHIASKERVSFIPEVISSNCRYDKFRFIETQTTDLSVVPPNVYFPYLGQYYYSIYEQLQSGNTNPALAYNKLESGRAVVIVGNDNPDDCFFEPYISNDENFAQVIYVSEEEQECINIVTPSVTPSNSPTPSITPTNTPSVTPTNTPTVTPTNTLTPTNTPTVTQTNTPSSTRLCKSYTLVGSISGFCTIFNWTNCDGTPGNITRCFGASATICALAGSVTQSGSGTITDNGICPTPTPTPTNTATPTVTPTNTATPTVTPSITPSVTPSITPTETPTNTPSVTPTNTPSVTPSITPSVTPSITPTETPTNTPTLTPTNTQTPTPSPGPAFDADAAAYLSAVLTAGGTLNSTISAATDTLFTSLKSNGLYSKMYAFYPLIGGTSASTAIMGKRSFGTFHDIIWSGGWTFNSSGATGNAANTYGRMNISGGTVPATNSHIAVQGNKPNVNTNGYDLSMNFGNSAGQVQQLILNFVNTGGSYAEYTGYVPVLGGTTGDFLTMTRNAINTITHRARNGVALVDKTEACNNIDNTRQWFLGCEQASGGGTGSFTQNRYCWMGFGSLLTPSELLTYQNIINTFQTSLGRNTY
jgi:hypothetical protein